MFILSIIDLVIALFMFILSITDPVIILFMFVCQSLTLLLQSQRCSDFFKVAANMCSLYKSKIYQDGEVWNPLID
jgi:hypothetical protein